MAIIRYLHLGLTAACNLNCKHCFIKEKDSKELSFEKAIAFIDVLEKQGLTHIYYTYGEPLLYHRLFEFSKNIRLKGIYQVLMTNGTQINYEVAQKIATSGINRVMIVNHNKAKLFRTSRNRKVGSRKSNSVYQLSCLSRTKQNCLPA